MNTLISSPWTAVHDTPNKSPRQNVERRGALVHHAAMTSLDGLRRLAMGAKEVSADAIIKDDIRERLIPLSGWRAWSASSAWADSSFRSMEVANETVDDWTVSEASIQSIAWVIAWWAQLDGFWPHREGDPQEWTVIGHGELLPIWNVSYGTSCPGRIPLDRVTNLAQQRLMAVPPEPVVVTGKRRRMFTFIRNKKDGSIVLVNGEAGTYRGLRGGEWAGYAANGWKYADLEPGEYQATIESLKRA